MRKKAKAPAPSEPVADTEETRDLLTGNLLATQPAGVTFDNCAISYLPGGPPVYGNFTDQSTAALTRKPQAGQQVRFTRYPFATPVPDEPALYVAWIDVVHEGGSEESRPFVDLTYHTQDERGAAFAKNIPHDPTGTKDCSWCWREGK